jgi:hypothetical protein
MGNKVSLEENLIDLRIVSKQMSRSAQKCEKNEKAALAKLKKVRFYCWHTVVFVRATTINVERDYQFLLFFRNAPRLLFDFAAAKPHSNILYIHNRKCTFRSHTHTRHDNSSHTHTHDNIH